MATSKAKPKPHVLSAKFADPDLVDRIFDYVLQVLPELAGRHVEIKKSIRAEFASEEAYIRRRSVDEEDPLAHQILQIFNGRNATEVARALGVSRATVYRKLKQPGRSPA